MPIYQFTARDAQGTASEGTLYGANEQAVMHLLQQRGWVVDSLAPVQGAVQPGTAPAQVPFSPPAQSRPQPAAVSAQPQGPSSQVAPPPGTGYIPFDPTTAPPQRGAPGLRPDITLRQALLQTPTYDELFFFFRQSAAMLDAGMNPYEVMTSLSRQSQSRKLGPILEHFKAATLEGQPLSSVMRQYPQAFSPVMLSVVEAGERGGFLPRSMYEVSEYLDTMITIQRETRRQTMMPKLIIGFAILMTLGVNGIIGMIRPGAVTLYNPLLDPNVLKYLVPLALIILAYVLYFRKKNSVQQTESRLRLTLPMLADIERMFSMARFSRAFSALYRAGVPMAETMHLAAGASGNEYLAGHIRQQIPIIERGGVPSEALASTGLFPYAVIDMMAVGERTGNIDGMLSKVAEYFEDEAKVRARRNSMIAGIVVYVFAALLVFNMMLNFYGAYFGSIMSNANE